MSGGADASRGDGAELQQDTEGYFVLGEADTSRGDGGELKQDTGNLLVLEETETSLEDGEELKRNVRNLAAQNKRLIDKLKQTKDLLRSARKELDIANEKLELTSSTSSGFVEVDKASQGRAGLLISHAGNVLVGADLSADLVEGENQNTLDETAMALLNAMAGLVEVFSNPVLAGLFTDGSRGFANRSEVSAEEDGIRRRQEHYMKGVTAMDFKGPLFQASAVVKANLEKYLKMCEGESEGEGGVANKFITAETAVRNASVTTLAQTCAMLASMHPHCEVTLDLAIQTKQENGVEPNPEDTSVVNNVVMQIAQSGIFAGKALELVDAVLHEKLKQAFLMRMQEQFVYLTGKINNMQGGKGGKKQGEEDPKQKQPTRCSNLLLTCMAILDSLEITLQLSENPKQGGKAEYRGEVGAQPLQGFREVPLPAVQLLTHVFRDIFAMVSVEFVTEEGIFSCKRTGAMMPTSIISGWLSMISGSFHGIPDAIQRVLGMKESEMIGDIQVDTDDDSEDEHEDYNDQGKRPVIEDKGKGKKSVIKGNCKGKRPVIQGSGKGGKSVIADYRKRAARAMEKQANQKRARTDGGSSSGSGGNPDGGSSSGSGGNQNVYHPWARTVLGYPK